MKFNNIIKLFSGAAAIAAMVALQACQENKFTWDETWLDPEVTDDPSDSEDPTKPVEPTYDFQVMSKNVKIDPTIRYQVLDGIGASDCWLPNKLGQYWTSNRQRMAELLFSQEINNGVPKGIGLSTWRVNLGAGSEEQGDKSMITNVNNRMPSYAEGTASSLTYNWDKCPGQRYFMEQAKQMGVESFVLFANSPITQYSKNGLGTSWTGSKANLKDTYYGDQALYWATVAEHFVNLGYNISHISPVNEPQFDWNGDSQEGSGWQNPQIAKIARELQSALDAKNISTKISLGEAASWDCLYEGENVRHNTLFRFYDPSSDAYIGDLSRVDNIGGHSYWTDGNWRDMQSIRQKTADAAGAYGAKLWQTEWSMLASGEPSHYGDLLAKANPWTIAQWMAAVIHNDFTVTGVTAWHFWTALSVERWSQMDRFMLINCVPAGGNYSDDFTQEGTIEAFPTLWVLGNYSLFVRPGYQRIDLNMIESENFFGDAWISPDGKKLVCVYTNRQDERGVRLKISNASLGDVESIMVYTTTTDKNLEGKQWDMQFPVVLEPSSVSTVVYTLK